MKKPDKADSTNQNKTNPDFLQESEVITGQALKERMAKEFLDDRLCLRSSPHNICLMAAALILVEKLAD